MDIHPPVEESRIALRGRRTAACESGVRANIAHAREARLCEKKFSRLIADVGLPLSPLRTSIQRPRSMYMSDCDAQHERVAAQDTALGTPTGSGAHPSLIYNRAPAWRLSG